jgi:hypothetical protein
MKIRQLQHRVAVEFRCQSLDADLDILQGWHPYRMHADRGDSGLARLNERVWECFKALGHGR